MVKILTADDVSATVRAADQFLEEHRTSAPWEWSDQCAAARYADVLRYAGRHVSLSGGVLMVRVPRTRDGEIWQHVAADILDRAMAERHGGNGYIATDVPRGATFVL